MEGEQSYHITIEKKNPTQIILQDRKKPETCRHVKIERKDRCSKWNYMLGGQKKKKEK